MKILPPKIVWRLKKDHQHSSAAAAGFSRPLAYAGGQIAGFVSLRRDEKPIIAQDPSKPEFRSCRWWRVG
jgi:hypothetical protein